MKRTLLWTAALLILASLSAGALADSRDWSLVDTDGNTFSTETQLGDAPTLLLFWATWCNPCKKELVDLRGYFDGLVERGVHVILIAENNTKTQSQVKPYVDSKKFTWPVLLDPTGEVLKRYGGGSVLPYRVILDKNGKAVQKATGAIKDTTALNEQLNSLSGGDGD